MSKVHAFEPTPEIAAQLRRNRDLNGCVNITVHEAAVGRADETLSLVRFRGERGDKEGLNYLAGSTLPKGAETIPVQVRALDQVVSDLGVAHIDLMKLDVQGHEPAALDGAKRLLETGAIRRLFIELNWSFPCDPNCPAQASINRLKAAGYVLAPMAAGTVWRAAGSWLRAETDFIAMPRSICPGPIEP